MKNILLQASLFMSNLKINCLMYTVIFLSGLFLFGCNSQKLAALEEEKTSLERQVDSLKQINDSIYKNIALLFDKALSLEEHNINEAILIYKEISEKKDGSFWTIESEKRLSDLSPVKQRGVKYPSELYWLTDTLELTQTNAKCGEWGGDYEVIKIFSKMGDNFRFKLFGYYFCCVMDCDDLRTLPENDTIKIIQSRVKELTDQDILLMQEAVLDLVKYKMENNTFFCHAGISNTVNIKNDKSRDAIFTQLSISDYPSFTWNKFHKLKRRLQ